ncbi:hypothetical protein J5X98_12815 [Leptothermofonsia sichuanensis E412]|uniref:hypothetical protein n=1 Tax=Leptothermofonsia sichuanensis TaxID=2917832 RepID=UPI001CA68D69|nr:hypothetical protein [Leptothermofonsia sichuanensis]QZZ23132.1 hypothetical protein J5X98_12815 [Leptothermofonsia sichuanensis E412]
MADAAAFVVEMSISSGLKFVQPLWTQCATVSRPLVFERMIGDADNIQHVLLWVF